MICVAWPTWPRNLFNVGRHRCGKVFASRTSLMLGHSMVTAGSCSMPNFHVQDYSAFFYPSSGVATASATATATAHHRPKQQGRLKLCSRGLLFEPADRLSPLVRYPFRHMETQMEPIGSGYGGGGWGWGGHSKDGARGRSSTAFRNGGSPGVEGEAFRFRCTVVVESRKNDEVNRCV